MKTNFLNMKKEEFKYYLDSAYPDVFREAITKFTDKNIGICCKAGWFSIITDVFERVDMIQKTTGIKTIFIKIKEHYGILRIFHRFDITGSTLSINEINHWQEIVVSIIRNAENLSQLTCESCGDKVFISKSINGWIYTQCNKCLKSNISDDNIDTVIVEYEKRHDIIEELNSFFDSARTIELQQLLTVFKKQYENY